MALEEILDKIIKIATAEIGVKEVVGEEDNPRIIEYKQTTPAVAETHDEIAWCSSFVNWVLGEAGVTGTGNPMARSFLNWGDKTTDPVPGCVVVLRRGKDERLGHVSFFLHRKRNFPIFSALGGNQSDMVKISQYNEADVLGYRIPPEEDV